MPQYQHGVYNQELETSLQPIIESESNLIVAIGTSPEPISVNKPEICYSLEEFKEKFGWSDDFDSYTLCEAAHCQFSLYNMSPIVCINVFDGTKHYKETTTPAEEEGGDPTITRTSDVSKVTTSDILAGIEKIEEVYPRFNLVPSILIAPKYSQDADVIAGLRAKTSNLNGHFKSIAVVDIPTERAAEYSQATSVKTSLNISDPSVIACWGICKLNGRKYNLATQLASLMHYVDSQNGENPSVSPSNQSLQMDSMCVSNGNEVFLTSSQATYLNSQGIVTALNFQGWKAWGNRTSVYPSTADPKDAMIPVRRVFSWIGNTLITSYWSQIDSRLTRRFIDAALNRAQIWLDGLTAAGILLGGTVSFNEDDNPLTSLQDGIVTFRVQLTPPSPARVITFLLQYDPSALRSLFETE